MDLEPQNQLFGRKDLEIQPRASSYSGHPTRGCIPVGWSVWLFTGLYPQEKRRMHTLRLRIGRHPRKYLESKEGVACPAHHSRMDQYSNLIWNLKSQFLPTQKGRYSAPQRCETTSYQGCEDIRLSLSGVREVSRQSFRDVRKLSDTAKIAFFL